MTTRRRLLWILLILAPLVLGLGLVLWRSGEDALVARAAAQLRAGEWEASLATLQTLRRRPLLSSEGRRRGAELFFRLGEDQDGHTLLKGQRFDEKDPEDRRLKELTSRNLRAARLLEQAERARDPEDRLRLVRSAQIELPEAPRVLQRVVLEELADVTAARSEAEAQKRVEEYLEDYAELRRKAPSLAAAVKERHEELRQKLAGPVSDL